MNEFLHTLLNSLNSIEIKGKDNLEILIGCIYAIESKIAEIEASEQIPGSIINEQEVNDNG